MPASTIVASNGRLRLYDDSVQTFDQLPVATYAIEFSKVGGYCLRQVTPLTPGEEAVYGSNNQRVKHILRAYDAMDRSMGVLLSGDKGMGKSLMLRMLAEQAREQLQLPTILVQHSTPELASFLDELGEVVVVFDEFEKVFPAYEDDEAQHQFLSLFDGLSETKRLYVLTVNDLSKLSPYLRNRPGRCHFHMTFDYPDSEAIEKYLRDNVPGISTDQVREVIEFSRRYNLTFDHLRAISFELRLGQMPFAEFIRELNIKRVDRYDSYVTASVTWDEPHAESVVFTGRADLFDHDGEQRIIDHDNDLSLKFRMRDAEPTQDGFILRNGTFELHDLRAEFRRESEGERPKAAFVTLRRAAKRPIGF